MRIRHICSRLFLLCGLVAVPQVPLTSNAVAQSAQAQSETANWDSLANEIKRGREYAGQVEANWALLRYPGPNEYVEKLT